MLYTTRHCYGCSGFVQYGRPDCVLLRLSSHRWTRGVVALALLARVGDTLSLLPNFHARQSGKPWPFRCGPTLGKMGSSAPPMPAHSVSAAARAPGLCAETYAVTGLRSANRCCDSSPGTYTRCARLLRRSTSRGQPSNICSAISLRLTWRCGGAECAAGAVRGALDDVRVVDHLHDLGQFRVLSTLGKALDFRESFF